ncbi:MAG TPA: YwqG family protein, partial [Anaerolineae bacterium]
MEQATMMNAFATAGLARIASNLGRMAQPSFRISAKVADEAGIPLGSSKLGGLPDLPPDTAWPALNGAPMSFVAQIRLSDLHSLDAAQGLPATGLLSFFYDAQQQTFGDKPSTRDGWAVIYHDGAPVPAKLARLPAPGALPTEARFKACALTFTPEWTLPTDPAGESSSLKMSTDEQSKYETLLANYPTVNDHATIHHRLLGRPNWLQDDMRSQCQLMSHGVSSASDPRAAALMRDASKGQLLLQVDSDENAGMR